MKHGDTDNDRNPRRLLGTEAPVTTPNVIEFVFFAFCSHEGNRCNKLESWIAQVKLECYSLGSAQAALCNAISQALGQRHCIMLTHYCMGTTNEHGSGGQQATWCQWLGMETKPPYQVCWMVTDSSALPGSPVPGSQASGQCMSIKSKCLQPKSFNVFSHTSLQNTLYSSAIFI